MKDTVLIKHIIQTILQSQRRMVNSHVISSIKKYFFRKKNLCLPSFYPFKSQIDIISDRLVPLFACIVIDFLVRLRIAYIEFTGYSLPRDLISRRAMHCYDSKNFQLFYILTRQNRIFSTMMK